MPTMMAVPDSEPIIDLRRRVEELEARVAALGQVVTSAVGAKRGWRAQVGAFGDDPLYAEIVRLGRAWRDAQVPPQLQGDEG
jgi:hypothetical protein